MKINVNNIFEELLAGNVFPADIKTLSSEAQEKHLAKLNRFCDSLNLNQREAFAELLDEISSFQADAEEAFFKYGCEFTASFLIRSLSADSVSM